MAVKPTVFILHCGLDIKRLERACARVGLDVSFRRFFREEVFAYWMRLDRPRPDLIIIRSHFRSLVASLNQQKQIPTIVLSSHQKPADCSYSFVQAGCGYEGTAAYDAYQELAVNMRAVLQPA